MGPDASDRRVREDEVVVAATYRYLHPSRPRRVKFQCKCMEAVSIDRVPHFTHQLQVIVQVVNRIQARTQNFL